MQISGKVSLTQKSEEYCETVHSTQNNKQIKYYPYKNCNGVFHRNETNNSKMCIEPQKTPKSQNNLEKGE